MVFFFARWLLIAYSSKNEKKKRRFQSKAVRLFFWVGGEENRLKSVHPMTSMTIFFWSLPMIWRLKPFMTSGESSIPTPWPCFVFFKDIYIRENQRFFHQKRDHFGYRNTGIREYIFI